MWSDLLNTHSAVCIRLIDVSFDFWVVIYVPSMVRVCGVAVAVT